MQVAFAKGRGKEPLICLKRNLPTRPDHSPMALVVHEPQQRSYPTFAPLDRLLGSMFSHRFRQLLFHLEQPLILQFTDQQGGSFPESRE